MDSGGSVLSLSTPHFLYSATVLRRHSPVSSSISFSLKPPQQPQPSPEPPEIPPDLRRPEKSLSSSSSSSSSSSPTPSLPKAPLKNPLKGLTNNRSSVSLNQSEVATKFSSALASKLRLSSKLSPPPPPPPPPPVEETRARRETKPPKVEETQKPEPEFRQEGKIFVGNLPTWIKKPEFSEFFRQFGPIENVILIKGHHEIEKNAGFGFIIYATEKSAMKAVEFDGIEFHGRVLTVKLDDGKRLKTKAEQRVRWVQQEGEEEEDTKMSNKSSWHQEREGSRKSLQRILDTNGDNWQAVISAFEKINKVFTLFSELMNV